MIRALLISFLVFLCMLLKAQDPVSITFEKSDIFCVKGSATLGLNGGTPPYHITWSTGDTAKFSLNGLNEGSYSVHFKDEADLDSTISFAIKLHECDVSISNHFTPNNDGFNDTWSIQNASRHPNFELIVFNRSGQMVHHQTGQYEPWNGTSLGIQLPDATYYYIFYFDKDVKSRFLKGDVSILR